MSQMSRISGVDHSRLSSRDAVKRATTYYTELTTQFQYLEETRWRKLKINNITLDEIIEAADRFDTTEDAVIIVLNRCHKAPRTITRREIINLTGMPALPTMRAVCSLLEIPVSLRGVNPRRVNEKGMGARGHPVHFAEELRSWH